jgi:hypothetical protein
MVWLLIAVSIYAIIFVAGRAHSRYLDRLEARRRVVMTVQLFNVSPDLVKETEFTVDLTSEAIHNIPIESLDSLSVRNESQTCVSAPTADNRTFNHGIRLVPDEAELHEAYAEMAAEVRGVANITNSKEERGGRKIEPASAPLGANTAMRLN